jgi:hypothetical protein
MPNVAVRAAAALLFALLGLLALSRGALGLAPLPPAVLEARLPAAELTPDAIDLTLTLTNRAGKNTYFSHVEAGERHYDPFLVELVWPTAGPGGCAAGAAVRKSRTIGLWDERDKSAPVMVTLGPGKSFSHTVDLDAWARRKVNGSVPIGPGWYKVRVVYDGTTGGSGAWSGKVRAPDVRLTVSGAPSGDMCPKNPGWDSW